MRGFVILSPSHLEKVPPLYFIGWGVGGEKVPHFSFSEDNAERFPSLEAANRFVAEKLPGALERLQVRLSRK